MVNGIKELENMADRIIDEVIEFRVEGGSYVRESVKSDIVALLSNLE